MNAKTSGVQRDMLIKFLSYFIVLSNNESFLFSRIFSFSVSFEFISYRATVIYLFRREGLF
jgi:hypothetical protein